MMSGRIALLASDPLLAGELARLLCRAGFELRLAEDTPALLDLLASGEPVDLVLAAEAPGDGCPNAVQVLTMARTAGLDVPFLLFSAEPTLAEMLEVSRAGGARLLHNAGSPRALVEAAEAILRSELRLPPPSDGARATLGL